MTSVPLRSVIVVMVVGLELVARARSVRVGMGLRASA